MRAPARTLAMAENAVTNSLGPSGLQDLKFSLFTGICTGPGLNAGAEMTRGIGSEGGTPPVVTRNHRREGADARGDRNTHPALARLWGLRLGGRRGDQHPDPGDPADGPGALLRLWGLRDRRAIRPQLDGAPDPGPALGDVAGVAADRGPSRALSSLRGAHGAAALRRGQGALHHPVGGGSGGGL